MLNHSASLAMSTSVLKVLPGKLYIKRHTPSILYLSCADLEGILGVLSPSPGISQAGLPTFMFRNIPFLIFMA